MTSAEMLQLILNINLMIGDLLTEEGEIRNLLSQLQTLVHFVTTEKITVHTQNTLRLCIKEYFFSLNNYSLNHFKPKHHFTSVVHYPPIMDAIGPLRSVCCMRFESINGKGKKNSRYACSELYFYSVGMLMVNKADNKCCIKARQFNDIFLEEHYKAYKIYDIDNHKIKIMIFANFQDIIF